MCVVYKYLFLFIWIYMINKKDIIVSPKWIPKDKQKKLQKHTIVCIQSGSVVFEWILFLKIMQVRIFKHKNPILRQ